MFLQILKIILLIPNVYIMLTLVFLIIFKIYDIFRIRGTINIIEYPEISILIPAHNEGKVIGDTVNSIKKQINSYNNNIQIIVIVHNCTDNTLEILKNIDGIEIIECNTGNTKGDALNIGLKSVKYEWTCVIDSDTFLPDNYFKKVFKQVSFYEYDAIQTQVRSSNKSFLADMSDFECVIHGKTKQYLFDKGNFALLGGTGQFVKTNIIKECNGWSNNLADDTELSIRILEKGYKIGFTDKTCVYIQAVTSIKAFIKQRTRWCQGNTSLIFKIWNINLIKSINIFFCVNGILLSPFVKISNILFLINFIIFNDLNFGLYCIVPYLSLLIFACIIGKINPLKIVIYYLYSQLVYLVYLNTFYKIITKDNKWAKTERLDNAVLKNVI